MSSEGVVEFKGTLVPFLRVPLVESPPGEERPPEASEVAGHVGER